MIEFGGKKARKTGSYKSLIYSMQYVNGEPSLVLRRLADQSAMVSWRNAAVVIGLSSAHRYRSDTEKHLRDNFENFINAAMALGLDPTSKADLRMFMDCCEHLLDDLVRMKPDPDELKPNVEAEFDAANRKVILH